MSVGLIASLAHKSRITAQYFFRITLQGVYNKMKVVFLSMTLQDLFVHVFEDFP